MLHFFDFLQAIFLLSVDQSPVVRSRALAVLSDVLQKKLFTIEQANRLILVPPPHLR